MRIDLDFPMGGFTAIVGGSGCGKSAVAGILMGCNKGYSGSVMEHGAHEELLKRNGRYAALWDAQQSLENYGKDGESA